LATTAETDGADGLLDLRGGPLDPEGARWPSREEVAMGLIWLAAVFAAAGVFFTVMAVRFRRGRAEHLRRQPYQGSLWPAARRNIAYAYFPAAGMLFLTALSVVAQVVGLGGPVISAVYLLLMLALLVLLVVFMVKRPHWLDPHRPGTATAHPEPVRDQESTEEPPRPVSEMSPKELAEWARGDPEKLRRLMRRYK
jgi:hypothetical protein